MRTRSAFLLALPANLMLSAAWHMLRADTKRHVLGAAHFDRADVTKAANWLIRRLQQIGYAVHATPA